MISYNFRRDAFHKPETWTIFEKGLRYAEEEGVFADYPFSNLQSIRLSYFPTRQKTNNYVCTLAFTRMGSIEEIKIMSISYEGFANFEDKANSYREFIDTMVKAAWQANSQIQFYTGKKPFTY